MLVWKTQHGHNWRPYLITSHQKETHLNIITTTPKSKTEKVPHRFILHIYPRSNSHRKSGKKINWNQWTLNIYTAPFTPHHQSCPIFNIPCTRMAPWQSCLKKKKKKIIGDTQVCAISWVFLPHAYTHTLAEVLLCFLLDPQRQNGSCSPAPSSIFFNLLHTSFRRGSLVPHHHYLPFTYLFTPTQCLAQNTKRKHVAKTGERTRN